MAAPLPASIPAQDLVGRWGLAAYHKDEDRARTEAAARGQCSQPYNISAVRAAAWSCICPIRRSRPS